MINLEGVKYLHQAEAFFKAAEAVWEKFHVKEKGMESLLRDCGMPYYFLAHQTAELLLKAELFLVGFKSYVRHDLFALLKECHEQKIELSKNFIFICESLEHGNTPYLFEEAPTIDWATIKKAKNNYRYLENAHVNERHGVSHGFSGPDVLQALHVLRDQIENLQERYKAQQKTLEKDTV